MRRFGAVAVAAAVLTGVLPALPVLAASEQASAARLGAGPDPAPPAGSVTGRYEFPDMTAPASATTPTGAGVASGAAAAGEDADSARQYPFGSAEGVSERARWSTLPDGRQRVELSPVPVRFRDARGAWQDIDLSATPAGDGRLQARASGRADRIGATSRGVVVDLDTPAGRLSVSHPEATGTKAAAQGRAVRFEGGLTRGRDLVESFMTGGVKEEVVLADASGGPSYQVEIGLPAGVTARQAGESVEFAAADGTVPALATGGLANDSAKTESGTGAETPVTVHLLSQAARRAVLEVRISPAWLADPARVFPVVIDPSYLWSIGSISGCASSGSTSVYDSCDTYVNSDNYDASPGYHTQTQLRTGSPGQKDQYLAQNNRTRTLLQFPLDCLACPEFNTEIQRVSTGDVTTSTPRLELTTFGGSTTAGYTDLYGTNGPVNAATNWRNQPGREDGYGYAAFRYFAGGAGRVAFSSDGIRALLQRWMEGTNPHYVLRLEAYDELSTSLFRQYYSGEAGSASAPSLTFDYKTVPNRPRSATASAGDARVAVSWEAVTGYDTGGEPIDKYRVRLYQEGVSTPVSTQEVCASCLSAAFTGLTNGVRYRAEIHAHNRLGFNAFNGRYTSYVTPQPVPVPTVSKTVASAAGALPAAVYARGQKVKYTVTVTNPSTTDPQTVKVADTLAPQLAVDPAEIRIGTQTCAEAGVVCTVDALGSAPSLSIDKLALPTGGSRTISYEAVVDAASLRTCATVSNTVTATGPTGTSLPASVSALVCDSGLGMESWWSYAATSEVGPQGTAQVNVGNGNLVVQQVDSTPVQAHGRLGYVLRRTYNSQDSQVLNLPGGIGAGWTLNVGEAGDALADGVSPAGLSVPKVATLARPTAVTLADRDGTRHTFTPKLQGLQAGSGVPVLGVGVSDPAALGPLAPRALKSLLTGGSGLDSLCLDVAYNAPAGVRLGLYRYIALNATSTAPCTPEAGSAAPVVAGFATVRPDRLRSEYSWDGRLLSQLDGAGVELAYGYAANAAPTSSTTLGVPLPGVQLGPLTLVHEPRSCSVSDAQAAGSTCRAFRFDHSVANQTTVSDSAGRATVYVFNTATPRQLAEVRNPDGTRLSYRYDTGSADACSPTTGQLCAMTDPRGATTSLSYASAPAGPARVSALTDRRGTRTELAYSTDGVTTTSVTGGDRKRTFTGIDSAGRVGEIADTNNPTDGSAGVLYRQTRFGWDRPASGSSAAVTCRQPNDGRVDNNLCEVTALQVGSGSAPRQLTRTTYTAAGNPLIVRRANGAGESFDVTSYGYRVQYAGSNGVLRPFEDVTAAGGTVRSQTSDSTGSRSDAAAGALYLLEDRIETLPPRGNQTAVPSGGRCADTTACRAYLSSIAVDTAAGTQPNTVVTGAICASGAATSNTGLVCRVDGPVFAGSTRSTTVYDYDTFGQRSRMKTPKAVATSGVSLGSDVYSYSYFPDSALDLSGRVSAGGWLRAVTDPAGEFVAYGYDRAGNAARTWDRGATDRAGQPVSAYPGSISTPPSGEFSQELRGSTDTATALRGPWRYVTTSRDALGNTTASCVDANGNPTLSRPARGVLADGLPSCSNPTAAGHDTVLAPATADDQTVSVLLPEQAARNGADTDRPTRYGYNAHGELVAVTNPRGQVRTMSYDPASRQTRVAWTRGPWTASATQGTAECANTRATTAADAPLPADRILCASTMGFDGLDQLIARTDAAGGRVDMTFDALGRTTATTATRSSTVALRTEIRYDADGNTVDVCPPREFTEGLGRCTAGDPPSARKFSTRIDYDPAGRPVQQSRYRESAVGSSSTVPLITTVSYDADGNPTRATDANANAADPTVRWATTAEYDLLGRRTSLTTPRAAGAAGAVEAYTTRTRHDAVGNPTAVIRQNTPNPDSVTAYRYDALNRVVDSVSAASSESASSAGLYDPQSGSNIRSRRFYDPNGNVVAVLTPRAFAPADGLSVTLDAPNTAFLHRIDYDRDNRPVGGFRGRYDERVGALSDPQLDPAQTRDCPTGTGNRPAAVAVPPAMPPVPGFPGQVGVCASRVSYDPAGNLSVERFATSNGTDARFRAYRYTDDDLLAAVDEPNPNGTGRALSTMRYDGGGRPTVTTDGNGHASEAVYNLDGTLARSKQPTTTGLNGETFSHISRYDYDAAGNQTTQTNALDQVASWRYYSDNTLAETTDTGGATTAGSRTSGANTTRYGYDRNGNPVEVFSPSAVARDATNPAGVPTRHDYTYDNLLASTLTPLETDSSNATLLRRVAYSYDGGGRKQTVSTAEVSPTAPTLPLPGRDGGTQRFSYDPADRLVTQTGRDGATITTRYDATGQPTRIVDSTGAGSTITAEHYLDGMIRTVTAGPTDPASATDVGATGRTHFYAYDGLGGRTARALRPAGSGPDEPIVGTTGTGTTRYGYNDAHLLASVHEAAMSSPVTLGYDSGGRVTSQSTPGGSSGGTRTAWNYNADDTVASQTLTRGSDVLARWGYGYDALARITSADHSGQAAAGSTTASPTGTESYAYDTAGRLDAYTAPGQAAVAVRHDADGNRTSYGSSSFAYRPDDSLKTASSGGSSRSFSYTPWGGQAGDGCTTYRYDGFDRTAEAAGQTALGCPTPATVTHTYDGLDRQTSSTSTSTSTGAGGVPAGVAKVQHYDGLTEAVSLTSVVDLRETRYTLDPTGTPLAVALGTADGQYLHGDGRGSLTTTTAAEGSAVGTTAGVGTVTCTTRFDPYGTPAGKATDTTSSTLTASACTTGDSLSEIFYDGGRRDATTGAYQFGSRTYEPGKASWLTPDGYRTGSSAANLGLGVDPLTRNSYAYVNGDPVNLADPNGHEPQPHHRCMQPSGSRGSCEAATDKQHGSYKAGATNANHAANMDSTGKAKARQAARDEARQTAKAKKADCGRFGAWCKVRQGVAVVDALDLSLSDVVHTTLDAAGMVPVIGEVADGANALYYLAEGNSTMAAVSAAAMIPIAGNAVTAGKWGNTARKAVGAVRNATDSARGSVKAGASATKRTASKATEAVATSGRKAAGTAKAAAQRTPTVAKDRVAAVRGSGDRGSINIGGKGSAAEAGTRALNLPFKSPELRSQVGGVVRHFDEFGAPPPGVAQGGLKGFPQGTYGNKSGALPQRDMGYYTESDIWQSGNGVKRGADRLIFGRGGEVWFTPNHYDSFVRIR